ncbi:MAG: Minf_1886 family protein [Verrucomicrobiales bacterium]
MQSIDFEDLVEKLVSKNPRYPAQAYHFLKEALVYSQKKLVDSKKESARHLTGQELLEGIRLYAIDQFGPMAFTVFEEWGIRRCEDFGEMVFLMVDNNLLRKTEKDSIDDFKGGYSFDEAFRTPFVPAHKKAAIPHDRTTLPTVEQSKVGH